MLKELIHNKINEVFAEYQEANHIISGDIEPLDAMSLEHFENQLAQLIEKICAKQPRLDIDNLPKKFNFKSKINLVVKMYHAVEEDDGYRIISDGGCIYYYDKEEILDYLLKGDFVIIEKEINYDDFTPSWYIYTDCDGKAYSQTFSGDITEDGFFTKVSKKIAFDDLDDITVQKIFYKGKEVEYVGWQPGMKFEYTDLDGNTIWVGEFPHWDH